MQDINSKAEWDFQSAREVYDMPFFSLMDMAHNVHKANFDPQKIQVSALHSIQTGGCCQDCAYCAQSIKNNTKMPKQEMSDLDTVMRAARSAKAIGASRFCMGAAGKVPDPRTFDRVCEMVRSVKELGLETCVTLGCLTDDQIQQLKEAGLDYYNHNVDTSREFYPKIITTRTIDDRIETLRKVHEAGINLCSGGIVGMGESIDDRIKMLLLLRSLPAAPASVPINRLVKISGTALENAEDVDDFEIVRIIALTRIMMPTSYVRLSAGRESMSKMMQAMCFFVGANSIFSGDKLLTVANTAPEDDALLFQKLDLQAI